MSWLPGQTDYLFFIYGLAFFGLGVVSYLLSREVNQRLPWIWLALFGLTHGVHEWLDLLPLVWQAGSWFATCRWLSLALSFLFLAEFGRVSLVRQRGRGPGRWILGVLALIGCLGAWSGWNGLGATTRYALGLVGSLSAGLALYGEARGNDTGRTWLRAVGLGFIFYGLATGMTVPKAPFFPASTFNFQTFTFLTGLPPELLRTCLAVVIVAMGVGYLRSTWSAEFLESREYRVRYLYGMAIALVVILTTGWFFTQFLGNLAKEQVQKDTVSRGNLIIQRLTFELEEAEAAAKAMSGSPGLNPALVSRSPETLAQADSVLDRYQTMFGASPAYILDQTGTTVTSSNRDTPESFKNHNFAFRPYFQEPLKGLPGRYFALGSITKKPGFFAAYPVRDSGKKIVGVAVIKTEMGKFQQMLRESDPAFLIDPGGVIFLDSRPSPDHQSLWPVTVSVAEVEKSQFGASDFKPVFSRPQTDGAEVKLAGQTYLFSRQYINAPATAGWSLVLLAPHGEVVFYRLLGIATTLIVIVFTLLAAGSNLSIREGAQRIVASEARFRAMFDAAPEAVFVFDTKTRKIVGANPFMARWLGYSPEELVNLKIDQILAAESLNEEGRWQCPVGMKPISSQRYRQKNGSLVEVECTAAKLPYGDPGRELVFVRDITERKRAEADLHASLRFLEIVHQHTEIQPLLEAFVSEIKAHTNCEAVGIRVLEAAGGIPYMAYQGFSKHFYELESPLSIKSDQCMCINVIKGVANSAQPFYTQGGSFFMNGTSRFLATVSEEDKGKTRNVCNLEGYESVALVPFRRGDHVLGLIHVADKREDMVPRHLVEMLEQAGLQLGTAFLRVQAEEALRESEKHYRSLFDNMLNGFAYCRMIFAQDRPEDFIYLAVNGAFEVLTGLKNVIGKRVSELIPGVKESDPEIFEIYGRVALTGIPERFETYVAALEMWFAMAVYSPRQDHFVAIFDVITERKQAEEALRESEARFRGLFENMTEGVALHEVIYDDHGKAVDYRILSTNPAFEDHTGLKEAQVRGRLGSNVYGTDPAPYLETYALVARQGQPLAFESYFPPLQRHVHISVTSPKQGQFVTVLEDITEHKRAEEALASEAIRRRLLFEQSKDGIVVLDQNGKVYEANHKFVEMLGYSLEEVQQLYVWDWDAHWTREQLLEMFPRISPKGESFETVHRRKDGTVYDVEVSANWVMLAGQTLGFCVCRDISPRKKAEEERLRFGKLESLSTLAGGIAHDFNNILMAIMGNISLAMLDQPEKGHVRERLTAAERACLQAQSLSRQLLTFAKGGAPIKELISFEKLITEAASFATSGSQARCEFSFPDNLWAAEADPGQLNQVFQNLVINAIQAMPAGGTIKVRGENLAVEREDDLPLDAGRYVKISIQDRGIGIPADFLPKIFDPYFTTKQSGSGLGLATVYSIVKKHRGHIAVESKLGEGTTFQVYLPAVQGDTSRWPEVNRQVLSGQGRILVMDDEVVVRDLLKLMLGRLGYRVTLAKDGAGAIEMFTAAREAGEPFAALILDLTVPGGMGGKAAIEKLLKIDPRVKAIVSSGYSEDPVMADFKKSGFSGVISKPYRIAELSRVLNKVLASQS